MQNKLARYLIEKSNLLEKISFVFFFTFFSESMMDDWEKFKPLTLHVSFCFTILLFMIRSQQFKKAISVAWKNGLFFLVLYSVLSIFWSIAQQATIIELITLFEMTTIAMYASVRFSPSQIFRMFVVVFAVTAAASLIATWVMPEHAIHPGGEWRGIYNWKNFLGRVVSLGNLFLLIYLYYVKTPLQKALGMIFLLIAGLVLFFSKSNTSWFALLAIGACLFFAWLWGKLPLKHRYPFVSGIATLLCLGLFFAAWQNQLLIDLFSKGSFLNGRPELWVILGEQFQKAPWLGMGYGAFWSQYPNGMTLPGPIWNDASAYHAHNGYLDVAMSMGYAGLVLFFAFFAMTWKNALKYRSLATKSSLNSSWILIFLGHFAILNLMYSIAFEFPGFFWMLLVITSSIAAQGAQLEVKQPVKTAKLVKP